MEIYIFYKVVHIELNLFGYLVIWLFGPRSIRPSRPAHGPTGPDHYPQPESPLPHPHSLLAPLPHVLSWRCARARAASRRYVATPPPATLGPLQRP
jgi:hypothetical protein